MLGTKALSSFAKIVIRPIFIVRANFDDSTPCVSPTTRMQSASRSTVHQEVKILRPYLENLERRPPLGDSKNQLEYNMALGLELCQPSVTESVKGSGADRLSQATMALIVGNKIQGDVERGPELIVNAMDRHALRIRPSSSGASRTLITALPCVGRQSRNISSTTSS
jgi:hypothetical protein